MQILQHTTHQLRFWARKSENISRRCHRHQKICQILIGDLKTLQNIRGQKLFLHPGREEI
jgi:hypothetical protein